MRIAFIIYSMGLGGAERATATMANYLVAQGNEVCVISLAPSDKDFYALDRRVERIALNAAGASAGAWAAMVANIRRLTALRRCLRRVKPDVLIGMMAETASLSALATIGMSCFKIGAERLWPALSITNPFWYRVRAHAYGWIDVVVTQTEAGSEWVRRNTHAKRVVAIPNALSWPLATIEPAIPPDAIVPLGKKLLLAVGRMERQKGFDLLVAAFSIVTSRHPDWELVILGEGSERPSLISQVKEAGLSDRVRFPGRAGNIADWYERADLFVLSSRAEGFPNVLLEAMASGCPVVATHCDTGPSDIIQDGLNGMLVPTENIEALAATLRILMGNRSMRKHLSERAAEVRERYSDAVVIAQWDALFNTAGR